MYGLTGIPFGDVRTVTAPTLDPVTATEAKLRMRVTTTADDVSIAEQITAARIAAEHWTGRQFNTATYDWKFDRWPDGDEFRVPRPPLISVTSLKYIDTNGTEQTLAASEYTVDPTSEPGRIYLAYSKSWPDLRGDRNSITLRFICGYGATAATVPEPIQQAIFMMVADFYEFRNDLYAQKIEQLGAVKALLTPYRIIEV